jgi:SAM-dependent methyltransferase
MNGQPTGVITTPGTQDAARDTVRQRRRSEIAQRFGTLVETYGHDPRALDYGSWTSQQTRFRVIAEALPLNGRRVLDVGCGFADLADYLQARYGPVDYEGVDICPHMIEEARRRHPALSLRVLDIIEEDPGGLYDFVIANGIFYVWGDDAFEGMRAMIRRMFELSRRATAFTTLSTWAERREPGEFRADPSETLAFCRTLTRRVVLRHDYLPHDFAVFLHQDRRVR